MPRSNPGNCGGLVFNEASRDRVTVSGLFTTEGASANINDLMPIAAELSAVGVQLK
jgi:hypothetical protein